MGSVKDVPPPAIPAAQGADAAYLDLIREELQQERDRKNSLEERGMTLVTASGFLATVLFGLTAFAASRQTFRFDALLKSVLGAALGALLVSTIAGVLTNWLKNYELPSLQGLQNLLEEQYWGGRAIVGTKRAAEVRLNALKNARAQNNSKTGLLYVALGAELLGVALIGASVAIVFMRA